MADDFEFANKVPPSFDRVDRQWLQAFDCAAIMLKCGSCIIYIYITKAEAFQRETGDVLKNSETKGFNPGLIVLLVVVGLLLIFLIGNYVLYTYAQKTLPPRKKKPLSKKKMKKERLKQGVSAPGE